MIANVDRQSLQAARGGIAICKHELLDAAQSLRAHFDAISGWSNSDPQYRKLGNIIEECCAALKQPVSQLDQCSESVTRMLRALDDYNNAL